MAAATTLGALFSGALAKDTTHLVAYSGGSEKYQIAVKQAIEIVVPKWLLDSAEARVFQPEAAYRVPFLTGVVLCVTGGLDEGIRPHLCPSGACGVSYFIPYFRRSASEAQS